MKGKLDITVYVSSDISEAINMLKATGFKKIKTMYKELERSKSYSTHAVNLANDKNEYIGSAAFGRF